MATLNQLPLEHATGREVLLRVAYRRLVMDWREAQPGDLDAPVNWCYQRADHYTRSGFRAIARQIEYIAQAIHSGYHSAFYVVAQCTAFRRGALDERRRLLPSYKANRNPTPRVTNRGCRYDCWRDPANNAELPDDLGEVRNG